MTVTQRKIALPKINQAGLILSLVLLFRLSREWYWSFFSIRRFLSCRQGHCAGLRFLFQFTSVTQQAVARCQSSPGNQSLCRRILQVHSTCEQGCTYFISFPEPWLYPYWWVNNHVYVYDMVLCLHTVGPQQTSEWTSRGRDPRAWKKPESHPVLLLITVLNPLWDHGHQGSSSPS